MNERSSETMKSGDVVRLAVDVVAAYLGQNPLPADQIPGMIQAVHASLSNLGATNAPVVAEAKKPAVPVKKSVTPDYLICLEDGKRMKMLKRHLQTAYNMSPDEYRAKWNLPADYPMVAPNYANLRSEFAKSIGLGRKAGQAVPARKKRTPAKAKG